ncbi:tripartite tricarboxylate transporter TctB family protein [Acuticoccus sp. M5D2P5]|uniref:tripartite tricarboxylate transporter TctB family protein n=1 Tax=Acuticoccus kalidii TaxID=2910977 RepID=UPI001F229AF1|nr:tripartite tricarboxylate transporter TctB family protein [Acuticoccus kalidii]MCF3932682.1 tripartite tricarboxylate transporter TctB family protein [Acuticoccus kalidii]
MKRDVVLGLITAAVAIVLWRETLGVRNFAYAQVGAEVWPQIVIGVIFVLAIVQIVGGIRTASPAPDPDRDRPGLAARAFVPGAVFGSVCLFAVLVPFVGFPVAGVVMVMSLLSLIGARTGRAFAIHGAIAFASVLAMTLIFTEVMGILLPGWRL